MKQGLHTRLIQLAARRVGWDEAEDVVQTAYLQVWRHREYGPDRLGNERLLVWATLNAARDELRRRQHRPATLPLQPWHGGAGDPEAEALVRIEAERAVETAWSERARGWPVPVSLLLAAGWTERELARLSGFPLGTVKTARLRERDRMRQRAAG